MQAPDDPRVGTVVQERYRILERLDHGGMGVVYRAERLQLGRIVAIKFLHTMFATHPDFIKRFEREAKLMSRLEHPHCVSVIDFGVTDSAYIVMEFVTGTTLKDLIDDLDEPLPPDRAIRIARQILAGLAHAHDQGIVHRDVKPANIMLANVTGTGDHARILDFGLAKLCDPDQSTTSMVVGTPSYMSPEQTAGHANVDGRADIYACGLVLFELLTLARPFVADEPFEVIRMHRESPPPRLSARCEGRGFSPQLEALMAATLAKSPADRPQSPVELADALAAVPEATDDVPRTARFGPVEDEPENVGTAATVAIEIDSHALAPSAAAPRRRWSLRWLAPVALVAAGVGLWQTGWLQRRAADAVSAVDDMAGARPPAPDQAEPAPTLAAAEALIASGDSERAIRALHELRRRDPDDARASYLLGGLYHDKRWTAESLAAYAEAIDKDARYRKRAEIARRAIDALADPATRNKARALLLKRLGASAVPALRRAARRHADPAVREQAGAIADEIARAPR